MMNVRLLFLILLNFEFFFWHDGSRSIASNKQKKTSEIVSLLQTCFKVNIYHCSGWRCSCHFLLHKIAVSSGGWWTLRGFWRFGLRHPPFSLLGSISDLRERERARYAILHTRGAKLQSRHLVPLFQMVQVAHVSFSWADSQIQMKPAAGQICDVFANLLPRIVRISRMRNV